MCKNFLPDLSGVSLAAVYTVTQGSVALNTFPKLYYFIILITAVNLSLFFSVVTLGSALKFIIYPDGAGWALG